ncbi:MAG: hypothetical protein E7486_01900, partial [Ruminococcaceae bacterium]|nr:hypothetical protein [Oscillospiraceae bacterium]
MKKNLWQSVLAVLLSAAFFIVTLPIPAGAEEEILSSIPEGTFSNEDIYGGTMPLAELTDEDIVGELAERREASVKHFQLTDGTVVAAVYDEPVHFQNEAGQWIDLDNTLSDTGSDYENTEAPVRVKFSKNPSNGKLYTLQGSDYRIKWGLEGMRGAASARKIALLESEKDSKLGVRSTSERLIYENALTNVDLAYRVTGRGIKEDIILQSKDVAGSFVFTLQTNRMTVEQEGNEILLYNLDGQAVYVLSAPYMTDAAGRCSTLLTMTLSGSGNHHTVTLTPDAEWLESAAYPVVIDPVLEDSRSRSQDDMKSISVYTRDRSSAYPDGNDPGNTQDHGTFYVGNESSSYDNLRAVLKFDLPDTITSADRVIQSHLRLWKNSGSAVGDATMTVNIHQINTDSILSDANFNSLTWETLDGNFDTTIMDSQFVEATTADTHVWFDITTATREWYQSSREYFGIAFTSDNEFVSRKVVYFCSPVYSSTDEYKRPYVSIQYVNQNGLEDYLTYHSAGTAETGVFSVSDFTGNLVFSFSDAETTGNYMPIAVSHIYDSSTRSKQNNQTGTAYFGNGFRLNLYSRVLAVTDADLSQTYPYQFIDSDGTWHYFQLKSGQTNVYVNEYDSSSVLTRYTALQNGNERYELKLGETVAWYFREDGYPTRVRDITTGKTATLTMSGSKLTKVTDGAGHEITFGYTDRSGKQYLTSVTDPSGRVTTYSYDANNRLVSVVRPGNKGFSLVYDSAGNLTKLTSMNDPGVEVTYSGNLNRVSTLTELGVAGEAGRKLTFAYGTGSTTVTDRDGKSETMLFDSFGHTVSIQDHEGRAVFGKYTNTNDAKRHALTYTSDLRSNVTNYVANPDFEDSALSHWTNYNNTNPATGTTTLSTTDPYAGAKSMKITCNDTSGRYGYRQKLNIPEVAGETFTLSAWVKVTNITLNSTTPYGLMFYFGYKREDGSWAFHRSNPIKSASDWTRVSHTYTVPDDVVELYVTLGFENASGTAYFDNVQVEKGTVVNQYNMLDNGHFRDADNTALPAGWTASDHTGTGDYVTGGRFRMTGERENWQNIRQPVPVFGSAGDTYTVAAWAQADALERNHPNSDENRYFAIRLRIINLDGTEDKFYFDFEAKNPSKQFLSAQATAKKDYSTVEVALLYNYQKNAVWFDDVQLFREASQDLREYDSHGRLTKSTTSMGRSTTYLYDDNNGEISHRLKKITYPDGTTESYAYNDRNQVRLHAHPDGTTTSYFYDDNGNLLSTGTVYGTSAILSSGTTAYTGAYATSTTDPFGNTISMEIDPDSGLVESVTDAKNNTTTYQYNTNTHLVESVQSGNSKVVYEYHHILDDLTAIGHNTTSSPDATTSTAADVRYTFSYDQFGNRVRTSVGSRTLSTNLYAPYNGRLTRTTYGNGDYREPVYDSLDRVVGMKCNGITQYTDSYDANGYLGRRLDPINGLEYRYEYDSEGRATRAT